ncbi:MAG: FeoB-associated Cys-rich membrane protein [Desulfobacteraceae bacterium]|nr:MAG: FeoB-associated Cys-rich membrane protein [Desulfobacteraceae bacterium]
MEQTVMVFIVVGLAAGYIARVFYKKFRPGRSPCDCGCTGCNGKK